MTLSIHYIIELQVALDNDSFQLKKARLKRAQVFPDGATSKLIHPTSTKNSCINDVIWLPYFHFVIGEKFNDDLMQESLIFSSLQTKTKTSPKPVSPTTSIHV
jgi:hypothetical protein